jgi:CRP-like cAMP-binding protein
VKVPIQPARRLRYLQRCPLFADVPATRLATLIATARMLHFARNETVFHKGDRPSGIYVVVSGRFKEASISASGDEHIFELLGPGRSFGESPLLLDQPYPFFVAALVASRLLHIPRLPLLELLDTDRAFSGRMLETLSARLCTVFSDIEAYSLHTPLQRIAAYLLRLQNSHAAATFNLPAAKNVVATRLGMTPEALSRALRDLIDAGLIEVRGCRIAIKDASRLGGFAA